MGCGGSQKDKRSTPPQHVQGQIRFAAVRKKVTAYETGYAHATTLRDNVDVSDVVENMGELMRRMGWADAPMIDTRTQPATTSLRAVLDHVKGNTPVVAAYGESQDEPGVDFFLPDRYSWRMLLGRGAAW